MKKLAFIFIGIFFLLNVYSQSPSFETYVNSVIPGDHPDCTVTKIGKDFYTTGSSFNVTPTIYHSTDLVHWEAIAQPVKPSWSEYEDKPGGGCWGGQINQVVQANHDVYLRFKGKTIEELFDLKWIKF
jgi:xylan 1,4-beta-xylosidase